MKIFATILAIYVLVLTAMPCIDKPLDNTLHKSEITHNTTDSNHDESDHCSPFCTCYCCTSPIIYQVYIAKFNTYSVYQKQSVDYSSSYIFSLSSSIWQPPKIS